MSRWLSHLKWWFGTPPLPLIPPADPRLREPAAPFPCGIPGGADATIRSLEDTLHWFQARHGNAHGIAGPQIGIPERIIIVERDRREVPMVNPVIIRESPECRPVWERCMSFPHLAVCVGRPVSLSLRFVTREGMPEIWEDVEPRLASLVRHEVDHLDGILTLDRAGGPGMVEPWEMFRERHREDR